MNIRYLFTTLAGLLFFVRLAAQTDTIAPLINCKTQTYPVLPFCLSTSFPAAYFLDDFSDNATPADSLELGIRRVCVGEGFPDDRPEIMLWSSELWQHQIAEVWARDQAGNTAKCLTNIWVYENTNSCDPAISVYIMTPDTQTLSGANFHLLATHCVLDTLEIQEVTYQDPPFSWAGWWQFGGFATSGYTVTATASKNTDPLNGISTLDLVLIQKHLLGIEPFTSPYQFIAADANQDGNITSFDILLLKQLLLGVTNELPQGRSWRILPFEYVFPNPENPLSPPIPEQMYFPNTVEPVPSNFVFMGVKIGDVNFSADPGQ